MRYKAKSIAALQLALGSLPDKMRVEVEPDIEVSAKTVGELRKVTAWPETLAVTTPQERHADSAVKVSKVSAATRTAPKRRSGTITPPNCYRGRLNDRGVVILRLVDPRRKFAANAGRHRDRAPPVAPAKQEQLGSRRPCPGFFVVQLRIR